ncbi:MAG: hypothetical protein Q9177_006295 [Variospora cf. flavescens]
MGSNSFEEALSDLEMLADIRYSLRPSEFFKFRHTYNRKIFLVLNTNYDRFSDMISEQALQYLQRLTAVRAKLSDYMSTQGTEQLNGLVKVCLRATKAAIDQAEEISDGFNDQSWEVQLTPSISEDGNLPAKDLCGADTFAYDAGKKKFSYTRNGERIDDDLEMRMTTTLHDLAVRLPQPTTLATPRPLSELPDDISQRRGSCIAQFTPPKATK